MNKENQWAKTILVAYKFFPKICNTIDKMVENQALNSHCTSSANFNLTNIQKVASNIINLSNKKIDYINYKVILENSLKQMKKENAKILVLKYIYGQKNEQIITILKVSERTYFRKVASAVGELVEQLRINHFNFDSFIKFAEHEAWLKDIYLSVNSEERKKLANVEKTCVKFYKYRIVC